MGNSAALSMDSSDPKDDFDCPICQDVLAMPIRTKHCQHVFCKSCFQTAVRSQGPQCPMCRGSVSEREPKATDIAQRMRETKAKCRACGSEKFLYKMRLHYKTCKSYIDEYGPISNHTSVPAAQVSTQVPLQVLPQVVTQTPSSVDIPQTQFHFLPDSWILLRDYFPAQELSAHRLYTCPYCTVTGLSDMDLVEHCVLHHAQDRTPAVCPICVCLPFGDGNYYSQNLILHFLRRHRFSYSGYMNEDDDEDVQTSLAVQMSLDWF